jgi:hypothetical protein
MLQKGYYIPEGIKKEHIKQILCGMRKTISQKNILELSGQAFHLLYPDAEMIINSAQATTIGPYLPPGPTYNEREKRYGLTVINTIAPFSLESCTTLLKDFMISVAQA